MSRIYTNTRRAFRLINRITSVVVEKGSRERERERERGSNWGNGWERMWKAKKNDKTKTRGYAGGFFSLWFWQCSRVAKTTGGNICALDGGFLPFLDQSDSREKVEILRSQQRLPVARVEFEWCSKSFPGFTDKRLCFIVLRKSEESEFFLRFFSPFSLARVTLKPKVKAERKTRVRSGFYFPQRHFG